MTPNHGLAESQSTPSLPTPPQIARPRKLASDLDVRKPRVVSHYWKDEARKVSTELGKICEEAFNRSSVSSSSVSQGRPTESPATSVSTHDVPTAVRLNKELKNRPLPQPPPESLGSYTLRELADTRRRLLEHCEDNGSDKIPAYLTSVIANLDRLIEADHMQPETLDKRSASDPTPASVRSTTHRTAVSGRYHLSSKASLNPQSRHIYGTLSQRAASDPVKPTNKGSFQDATIRLVSPDPTSPMQIIPPLNVRKTKVEVLPGSLHGVPSESLRSTYERGGYDPRLYGCRGLDTIEEDPASPQKKGAQGSPGGNRKWSWFKRGSDPLGETPPTPPAKNSPIKFEPDGLDARGSQSSSTISQTSAPNGCETEPTVEKKRKWFQNMFRKGKAKGDTIPATSDHEIVNDVSETDSDRMSASNLIADRVPVVTRKLAQNVNPNNTRVNIAHGGRSVQISQNWFTKFLHIKPASKLICISMSKAKARKEVVKILKEWKKYGLRDVVSESQPGSGDMVRGRVDAMNCKNLFTPGYWTLKFPWANEVSDLHLKPVHFHAHLFTVLEHGRKCNLSVIRFTQERGAASSFYKVVDTLEAVLKERELTVEDPVKRRGIERSMKESEL